MHEVHFWRFLGNEKIKMRTMPKSLLRCYLETTRNFRLKLHVKHHLVFLGRSILNSKIKKP